MPSITGFGLAKKVMEYEIPIIFITAFNGKLIDIMKQEEVPHLLKPIDHEALVSIIQKVNIRKFPLLKSKLIDRLEEWSPHGSSA